jgi:hypothetical protein
MLGSAISICAGSTILQSVVVLYSSQNSSSMSLEAFLLEPWSTITIPQLHAAWLVEHSWPLQLLNTGCSRAGALLGRPAAPSLRCGSMLAMSGPFELTPSAARKLHCMAPHMLLLTTLMLCCRCFERCVRNFAACTPNGT